MATLLPRKTGSERIGPCLGVSLGRPNTRGIKERFYATSKVEEHASHIIVLAASKTLGITRKCKK